MSLHATLTVNEADLGRLTPTSAEVHLGHLRHNVRVLQERARHARLMGVVKADAYGHGAIPVVAALQAEGVHRFAVATVPEAVRLRRAGVTDSILVFTAPLPAFLPAYAEHGLDVTVSSPAVAEAVRDTARRHGPLRVHVKVDTGMGRLGVAPDEAEAVVRLLEGAPGITLAAVWTHFAMADEEGETYTDEQLDRFEAVLRRLGGAVPCVHTANSAAVLRCPRSFEAFDEVLVRTGIALYGLSNLPGLSLGVGLEPVMRFTSRVTHLKTVEAGTPISYGRNWQAARRTRIATVGAGYADGYPRLLTNRAEVGIGGRRYRQVGNVCMDMFMVEVGDDAVAVGDEVVLFGAGGPSTLEVAAWAQTIPYEVCCGVGPRVPRHYRDGSVDDPAPDGRATP